MEILFWGDAPALAPSRGAASKDVCSEIKIIDLMRMSHGLLLHSAVMSCLIPAEGRSGNFSGWASCLYMLGIPQQGAAAQILLAKTRQLMGACDDPHPGSCSALRGERLREHQGFPSHWWEWKQQSLLSLSDVPRSPAPNSATAPWPSGSQACQNMPEKVGKHLAPSPA